MCVHSFITRLQLKKISVMYEPSHVVITFQLLEMSSITTPNLKQFQIFGQGTFFKWFLGKISAILPNCRMKKIDLEVTCKRHHFFYWNSCKRLPNFVNVATLVTLIHNFEKSSLYINYHLNDILKFSEPCFKLLFKCPAIQNQ